MQGLTLGADPEIFVGVNGEVRSIIGKIGGTKDNPQPLPIGEGFAVQEDNVALEFNIPPSSSKDFFNANLDQALLFLEQLVKDRCDYSFVKSSAVSFPDAELEDPRSWVFGCDPDYNAWTLQRNPRPKARDKNLRSCGGHVHVGYANLTNEQKIELVRMMDLRLAVPSTLMDNGELRKELYGKGGAFRDKPYGLEYRTLSNYWVFSPKTRVWVYEQTEKALDAVLNGISATPEQERILQAVDNNDKEVAKALVEQYELEVV
jgi:hypothetical protein